ncbi:hypothetical protein N312_09223, partial [Balearica regulorum gibbericeps]
SVYLTDKPAPSRSARHGQHKQAAGQSQRREVGDNALQKTLRSRTKGEKSRHETRQVSSFCWGSDCKTQRGGGGQDAGSAWELHRAEQQPNLVEPSEINTRWPWKSQPQTQKVVPPLWPESTHKPTSVRPSRGRLRHHSITQSSCPRNRENITAVSWIVFYP